MPSRSLPKLNPAKLEVTPLRRSPNNGSPLSTLDEQPANVDDESPVYGSEPRRRFDNSRKSSVDFLVHERDFAPVLDIYRNIQYQPPRGTIASSKCQSSSPDPKRPKFYENGDQNSSNDDDDYDLRDKRSAYATACRQAKVSPNSSFIKQIGCSEICLKNRELTGPDVKAICMTLLRDRDVSSLDLTSNSIGVKGLFYVVQLLHANEGIDELNISDNWIGAGTLKHMTTFLRETRQLKRLDISGNSFNDRDGPDIAQIIEGNTSMEYLNASRNEFGDEAGRLIGPALAQNDVLVNLDFSWNHFRGKGADAISKAIGENDTLESLNISWNGFGFGGTLCMSQALKQNKTLTELDMSNNRIHQKQFLELMDGVMVNTTLRVLKVALNPIPAMFTSAFLLGIKQHPECGLREMDLSGVVVDREFEEILDAIHQERLFICHYERSLSVDREKELEKMKKSAYNIDPLKILFFMKANMRAIDFFRELDKSGGHTITREALANKFKVMNVEITSSALDRVFEYFGQKDTIELASFMDGERRHRRKTIAERRRSLANGEEPSAEFSSTFFKQGGETDSKERRLSQAVVDFMQRRRSVAEVPEQSAWRRVSDGMENGTISGSKSLDRLNVGDSYNEPEQLPRARPRSYDSRNEENSNDNNNSSLTLPRIRNRRQSLTQLPTSQSSNSSSPQRSRRSSIVPSLPAIITTDAADDE